MQMVPDRRWMLVAPATGLVLAGVALVVAGPLDPPAGAVSPTYKTLTEVEPRIAINATNTPGDTDSRFRINQPGSYYLTGHVFGVPGKHGIEIAADNVAIDLCGFSLFGTPNSLSGVTCDATGRGSITLRNGVICNWGSHGVNLPLNDPAGSKGFILDSIISRGNAGDGFVLGDGSILTHCSASQNTGTGFTSENHARFDGCIAAGNTREGFKGGSGCAYDGCVARSNMLEGFFVDSGASFTNCSASYNTRSGFYFSLSSALGCEASYNGQVGFAGDQSIVRSCNAINNTGGGIDTRNRGYIIDNNVVGGLYGIFANYGRSRIEGNRVSDAEIGITLYPLGGYNYAIRNSVHACTTNYSIYGSNFCAPIIDITDLDTSTNPLANVED